MSYFTNMNILNLRYNIITSIKTWESETMYFYNMNCLLHVIQEGDTLYSISRRYNVPISVLFKANPFVEIYNLQIGDELCVPVMQPAPPMDFETYIVQEGDTLEKVLEQFGVNLDDILQFNSISEGMFDRELQPGTIFQIPIFD